MEFQSRNAGPWSGPIGDIPTCSENEPMIFLALDGASESDCATGGGSVEVVCFCLDGAWAAGRGGASALDDLADVDTAGAAAGEALVYDGAQWEPSAAAAILEGDARLIDARAPTVHAATHEDGGADEIDVTGLSGKLAEGQPIIIEEETYTGIETDCDLSLGIPGSAAYLQCHDGQGYVYVEDEGNFLEPVEQVNFIGASITCATNAEESRTDCTVTDADTAAGKTFSGDGTAIATTTGAQTAGDCVEIDANGNHVASGGACGGGSTPTEIEDADQDTGVRAEASADEDVIRVRTAGTERLSIDNTGFSLFTRATGATPQARFKGGSILGAFAESGDIRIGGGSSGLELRLIFDWNTGNSRIQNGYSSGGMDLWVGGANNVEALDLSSIGTVMFWSQATAPATCTAGRSLYADTSGALCWCSATNTWENLSGVGSCA
jgi:hypothetical protein